MSVRWPVDRWISLYPAKSLKMDGHVTKVEVEYVTKMEHSAGDQKWCAKVSVFCNRMMSLYFVIHLKNQLQLDFFGK